MTHAIPSIQEEPTSAPGHDADRLRFNGDHSSELKAQQPDKRPPWKVLIADDDEEVHAVTKLALSDFQFAGRELQFISAYSGADACALLREHPDIAVLLLDVVMEDNDSGLQVVEYTRQVLGNNFVRIVLRTGHPGVAPERQVIRAYDINDYRAKTELTQDRMFSVMHASLGAYRHLTSLARGRFQLRALAREVAQVSRLSRSDLREPASQIATEAALLCKQLHEAGYAGAEDALARITRHAARIRQVADGVTKLGRVGTPGEMWRATDFAVAALVARERLAQLSRTRAERIRVSDLPTLPAYPQMIEEMFYQILGLGLRNPAATGDGLTVSAELTGRNWEFTITGVAPDANLDPETDPFDMFAQVRMPTSLGGPDAGVGMAMAKKIVQWHGGRIWLVPNSQDVRFTIPAAPLEPVDRA